MVANWSYWAFWSEVILTSSHILNHVYQETLLKTVDQTKTTFLDFFFHQNLFKDSLWSYKSSQNWIASVKINYFSKGKYLFFTDSLYLVS